MTVAVRIWGSVVVGARRASTGRMFFGFDERLRGHFTEIHEGENIAGGSLEMRIPVIEPRFFDVGFIPVESLRGWRFGMAASIFADVGEVWTRPQAFRFENALRGYGAGLNFFLPYGFFIRTEYAFNEQLRPEVIVELRPSF